MALMDDYVRQANFVSKKNSVHLHFLGENILLNFFTLGIHICKTWQFLSFNTRLGGEICFSNVHMHKGR